MPWSALVATVDRKSSRTIADSHNLLRKAIEVDSSLFPSIEDVADGEPKFQFQQISFYEHLIDVILCPSITEVHSLATRLIKYVFVSIIRHITPKDTCLS